MIYMLDWCVGQSCVDLQEKLSNKALRKEQKFYKLNWLINQRKK
jgi:hypothetical protein